MSKRSILSDTTKVLHFCLNEARGFREIHRHLGLSSPSTTSNLLKQLLEESWLVKDEGGKYRLGEGFIGLCQAVVRPQDMDQQLALACTELNDVCGHSSIVVRYEDEHTMRYIVSSDLRTGHHHLPKDTILPVTGTAFGYPYLAYAPKKTSEKILKAHAKEFNEPIKEKHALLNDIKEKGVCVRAEKLGSIVNGCFRIVAPIFKGEKNPFGAIAITALALPGVEASLPDLANQVKTKAEALSKLFE